MKHFVKTGCILAIGLVSLLAAGCVEEETVTAPELLDVEIVQTANFGDSISFKVNIAEPESIQNVTASLFYDGTEVSRTTLREVMDNPFEGLLYLPMKAGVADGEYEVLILALNTSAKHSEVTKKLSLTHAEYPYIEFVAADGTAYRFEKTGTNEYAVTGLFPQELSGYFRSPAPTETEFLAGRRQVYWSGSSWTASAKAPSSNTVLFSADEEITQNITLKFNTLDLKTTIPLFPTTFKLTENNKFITKNLKKGQPVYFEGLPSNCWIDVDFFEKDGDSYKFRAEDGQYKITREDSYSYIRVERMNGNDYAKYDGGDHNDAIWVIGNANFGKPSKDNKVDWNTDKGLCMAKIDDYKYQITMKLYLGLGFKFYWQKGWGGEFKRENYAEVNSDWFGPKEAGDMEQMDGDTYLATQYTDDSKWYRITLDVSAGTHGVKLYCEEIDL